MHRSGTDKKDKHNPNFGMKWHGPGFLVLLVLTFTGFYLALSTSWSGPYRFSILLHPALGVVSVLFFPFFYTRTMKKDFPNVSFARHLLPPLVCSLIVIAPSPTWPPTPKWLYIYSLLSGLYLYRAARAAARDIAPEKRADFRWNQAFFLLWLIVAVTGVMILLRTPFSGINYIYTQHRWWSIAYLAALTIYFLGLKRSPGPGRRWNLHPHPALRGVLFVLLAMAVVFAADLLAFHNNTAYKLHLSVITLERRTAEERNLVARFPVRTGAYDVTDGCGGGTNCHGQHVKELKLSNHDRSLHPAYFKKNLNEMSAEVGRHNTVICAGCHYPYGALDRSKSYEYFTRHGNFPCTFCHLVNAIGLDAADKRKSWYSLAYPRGHVEMFLNARGAPLPTLDDKTRLLISLNRTGHERLFKRALLRTDTFCQTCHHLQFKALNPNAQNLSKPACINCHMQPGRMPGFGPSKRNHFFPGANMHLAALLGDTRRAELNRRFAAGRVEVELPRTWKDLWSVRYKESDAPRRNPWLMLFLENLSPPRAGREWKFRIHTYNTGLGHPFPAAPLDLVRAWLEIEVRGEDSQLLFRNGGLDDKFNFLPGTHQLGGYMIGEDGQLVKHNRVWQIKKKVVERVIPFGDKTTDTFAFTPRTAGRVTITARWRYRKLNQEFMDWAYGPGRKTAPPVTVGEMEKTISVK